MVKRLLPTKGAGPNCAATPPGVLYYCAIFFHTGKDQEFRDAASPQSVAVLVRVDTVYPYTVYPYSKSQ